MADEVVKISDFYGALYKGLDTFNRERVGFLPSVNVDGNVARAAKGEKVISPIATAGAPVELEEASWADYKPEDKGSLDKVEVTIEHEKVVRINLSGNETRGLKNGGTYATILDEKIEDAFRSLGNMLEAYSAKKIVAGASRAVGTAGTTPFGTKDDFMDFAEVARVLDENGTPRDKRNLVLNSFAMANLRGKQSLLNKVNEAGTPEFLRFGYTTPIQGFRIWDSAGLETHVAGAGSGYAINGALVKGVKDLAIDSGSGVINAGDAVTIDGTTYIVGKEVEAGGSVLSLNRAGLIKGVADNTTITMVGNYEPNIAFHSDAFVLATRQLSDPDGGDGADEGFALTDPVSGITFDVRYYRMYHKAWLEIGLAYGGGVVKSENIVALLG